MIKKTNQREIKFNIKEIKSAYCSATFSPDGCVHKGKEPCGCDKPIPCWDCLEGALYRIFKSRH